jgi:hypothetical protein
MRGLFRWAVKVRLVNADPTVGVDNLPLPKNDGFAVWPEDDIAALVTSLSSLARTGDH